MRTMLEPAEVWNYFEENKGKLEKEPEIIASNPYLGIEIVLETAEGKPVISVLADGEVFIAEPCFNESDCKETVGRLYAENLEPTGFFESFNGFPDPLGIFEESEESERIAKQEDILDCAVLEMLDIFAPGYDALVEAYEVAEMLEEIKDFIGVYLYKEHGISIYRPMYIKGKGGEMEYHDRPYDYAFRESDD